jgi:hypothetical protein
LDLAQSASGLMLQTQIAFIRRKLALQGLK